MAVLQQITQWAKTRPAWQQEAVRRLLRQQALTAEDEDELYAMLKAAHGLAVAAKPELSDAESIPESVADSAPGTQRVVLQRMHSLRNVNALAEGQCVEFAESGVTVVYGENAAGKSGYSRVLKKACLAREKRADILPNVFDATSAAPPEATFDLCVDGAAKQERWVANAPSPRVLSQIAVFDSECARVYVDETNSVCYMPYGLDVFERLVKVCQEFRRRLEHEIESLPQPPRVLSEFSQGTLVGSVINALKHDTPAQSIEMLATLSDLQSKRLGDLRKLGADSKVNEPKVKAQTLRRQKRRVENLLTAIQELEKTLSAEQMQRLQFLRSDAEAAKAAAQLASSEAFKQEPLPGVGSDPWKQMFEAASRYSVLIAYPGQPFPVSEGDARCVLCQQPLDQEAGERLQRFAEFVRHDTAQVSARKSAAFSMAARAFASTDLQPEGHDPELLAEVREIDSSTADRLASYLDSMRARAGAIRRACQEGQWGGIPSLPESPTAHMKSIVDQLEADAKTLDGVAEPQEQTKLDAELRELEDRERLVAHKDEILTRLNALQKKHRLREATAETETGRITRKGAELSEEAITAKLRAALMRELEQLGLSHLPMTFRKTGEYGQTRHQLELPDSNLGRADLSEVLCEGEQSVVAIASFLAELETSSDNCGIVFDDPVCSLDHRYRERVAQRLVSEGQNRQVIIFTHDIVFLLAIHAAAAKEQVLLLAQTIRRSRRKVGVCEPGLPRDAMSVKQRLNELRADLDEARVAYEADDMDAYDGLAERIYALLRETWERAVEEVLLNDALNRFRPSVETRRLQKVSLEDSDYVTIDNAMSKCSTWMAGHDASGAIASPMPDPNAVEGDIRELGEFVNRVRRRQESVRKTRAAALAPPSAGKPP